MSRKPAVAEIVAALEGRWEGRGSGEYPTIEPFDYREVTTFLSRPDHPALVYDQRTWRQTPPDEVVSHWEVGFLRISSDGTVTSHNAQGGRAESLSGAWERNDTGWTIRLDATSFSGDQRVVAARRRLVLASGALTYDMWMHTTSTSELLLHLTAELSRTG